MFHFNYAFESVDEALCNSVLSSGTFFTGGYKANRIFMVDNSKTTIPFDWFSERTLFIHSINASTAGLKQEPISICCFFFKQTLIRISLFV